MKPKITITKFVMFEDGKHYRPYSPHYDRATKMKQRAPTVALDPSNAHNKQTGHRYPILNIITERQLCVWIFNNFGAGDYRVIAHRGGKLGAYTFWKGRINLDGYHFFEKNLTSSEIKSLHRDLANAEKEGDEDEINRVREDIKLEKEMLKLDVSEKKTKYGFTPFLRRSGKRGLFHYWDEPDMGLMPDYSEEELYG
jgi:hypothetical protein